MRLRFRAFLDSCEVHQRRDGIRARGPLQGQVYYCPVMAMSKDHEVVASLGQPHRVLLFELKGGQTAEDGSVATVATELFAALSLEEVIAYVRRRRQSTEIVELKVLGKVEVLSSSEHLA
jgi:hypothetical protein